MAEIESHALFASGQAAKPAARAFVDYLQQLLKNVLKGLAYKRLRQCSEPTRILQQLTLSPVLGACQFIGWRIKVIASSHVISQVANSYLRHPFIEQRMTSMAYEFYWVSGSPNSWRTMLALEYKKIPYVSKRLDPTKGESKTPEYLALNPRGKVPTLANGDFVVHESVAIMAYLEREFPDPALFGESSSEAGQIWQRILEFINYARDPMDDGVSRPLIPGTSWHQRRMGSGPRRFNRMQR